MISLKKNFLYMLSAFIGMGSFCTRSFRMEGIRETLEFLSGK